MSIARTGEVVWYVTGRFYTNPDQTLFDVGYFLHIQGVNGSLFAGEPMSESTALFTFSAEPFAAHTIDNGGLLLSVNLKGNFSIYLRETAGASFDDPDGFAAGQCIATFSRVAIVPTIKASLLTNVFTARLISSQPFELEGVRYDFAELVGYGITQWGTAAVEAASAPAVPFAGSAIRVG
jgi:hypothetical protein